MGACLAPIPSRRILAEGVGSLEKSRSTCQTGHRVDRTIRAPDDQRRYRTADCLAGRPTRERMVRRVRGSNIQAIQADWDDEAWCERGIIEFNGRPIGFVQWYEADAETTAVYRLPMGPRYWGIDIFIGEPSMFGRGIGTSEVRMLSNQIRNDHIADVVVIDPHQRNTRAIRSYVKVGFTYSHDLPAYETQDGITCDAILMTKRAPS
jgi:RimJ/RimL family protein N-acetyltransferase